MLPTISRSISPRKQAKTNQIHRNSTIYRNPDVFQFNFPRIYLHPFAAYSRASRPHYDLRGDSLGVWSVWQRGLLNLIDLEGEIHRDWEKLLNSDVLCLFLLARAGVCCEGMWVYSREINWDTLGLRVNFEFRCILEWRYMAIHRTWPILAHPDVYCR